jgi:hypothetical protein
MPHGSIILYHWWKNPIERTRNGVEKKLSGSAKPSRYRLDAAEGSDCEKRVPAGLKRR